MQDSFHSAVGNSWSRMFSLMQRNPLSHYFDNLGKTDLEMESLLTSIILVINSAMAVSRLSRSPEMEMTLSFVNGKKSWFWDNLILAPVFWLSSLITEPPRPIIEPIAVFGQSIFRRWLCAPDEPPPTDPPSAAAICGTCDSNFSSMFYNVEKGFMGSGHTTFAR